MQGTRIEIAKEAAKSVVNTFSNNDFVGVVTFSDDAQTLYSKKL
jgi:secreted protein with Ig-like and vWFA domain